MNIVFWGNKNDFLLRDMINFGLFLHKQVIVVECYEEMIETIKNHHCQLVVIMDNHQSSLLNVIISIKKLRKVPIYLITDSSSCTLDSFVDKVIRWPQDKDELMSIQEESFLKKESIFLKDGWNEFFVSICEIVAIEMHGRDYRLYTYDKEIEGNYYKIKEVVNSLSNDCFGRVQASVYVNFHHIVAIKNQRIIMSNHQEFEMSRRYKKLFISQYKLFKNR